jgi:hypothetical protein
MATRETHLCGACHCAVAPLRPHWAWSVAVVGAFAFFILLTALIGAGGLLIVGGGVVVFGLGTCVLGPLVAEASRPPVCPTCGRGVVSLADRPTHRGE